MSNLNVKNDKFSTQLYKPLLKYSNHLFDELCEAIKNEFEAVFNDEDFTVYVNGQQQTIDRITILCEYSKNSRNIINVTVKYEQLYTQENISNMISDWQTAHPGQQPDEAMFPTTDDIKFVKNYKVVINLITLTMKFDNNEFDIQNPDSIYKHFIYLLNDVNLSEIQIAIEEKLQKLEELLNYIVVDVVASPTNYGNATIETQTVVDFNDVNLFNNPTEITMVATSNEHYKFNNWTTKGKVIANTDTITINCTEHQTFIANFVKEKYTVTLSEDDNDKHYMLLLGDGIYEYGTKVEIIAKPIDNYYFVEWIDDNDNVISTDTCYTFNIEEDMVLHPVFSDTAPIKENDPTPQPNDNNEPGKTQVIG